MKSKLMEHFGDRIIQTEINGKPNVVTFRSTAKAILQDFYAHKKDDPEADKMRIIETAAKLIKDDIKSVETSNDVYPDTLHHVSWSILFTRLDSAALTKKYKCLYATL